LHYAHADRAAIGQRGLHNDSDIDGHDNDDDHDDVSHVIAVSCHWDVVSHCVVAVGSHIIIGIVGHCVIVAWTQMAA